MIIFMGVAGSGKSVQGRRLADELGYPWLSTGEFLRMLISGHRRTEMLKGKLISDPEIIQLVQKIFSMIDISQEFVMDGFPRTIAQADWLINQHKHKQLDINAVVHITASEAEVRKRLMSRGRQDDNTDAIGARFREFEDSIKPILAEFEEAGVKIIEINGEQPVDLVHSEIVRALRPTG